MDAIPELPMPDDIDADYSPQYVKLARILRAKIEAGEYKHGTSIPAASLMREHKVSKQVALNALAMLAANRYLDSPASSRPYRVTWEAPR
jgi:DNA-binding GntR family transcriptional regulator